MFNKNFGSHVSDGDTITCEVDGFTCTATIHDDPWMGNPWNEHDGHGPVSDWRPKESQRPGERVLFQGSGLCVFYDFAEAVKIAKRDGWGTEGDEGLTPGGKATRAAEADFDRLKAWMNDGWVWCGVAVTVAMAGVSLTGKFDHAEWGIESDSGDYLREVANELLGEALNAARAKVRELNELTAMGVVAASTGGSE